MTAGRAPRDAERSFVTEPSLAAKGAKVRSLDELAELRRIIRATLESPDVDGDDLDDFIMAVHETVANIVDPQQVASSSPSSGPPSSPPVALVAWSIFERPNSGASELRSRIRILGTMPPAIDPSSLRGTIVRHVTDTITVTELIGGSVVEIRCAPTR